MVVFVIVMLVLFLECRSWKLVVFLAENAYQQQAPARKVL